VCTPDGLAPEGQPKWRRDFPIDWPEDHYVARRDFTKFMVLTSFAFVVGQLWIGMHNIFRRRAGRPPVTKIADVASIPVGAALNFSYPTHHDPCLLIRTGQDTFVAFGNKCSHLACAVLPDVEHNVLRCPCHHGYFDLPTGRPIAGPPRRPLPRILLEFRGGGVYASGVELRTV
jgi:nitrite reductase/ring-hydroxylating ferredoxin subunit